MPPIVTPKEKPAKPKTMTVSLRLPVDLVSEIDEVAKETKNSRNEVSTQLLQHALKANKSKSR